MTSRHSAREPRRSLLGPLGPAIRLSWEASPSGLVSALVLSVLASLAPLVVLWFGKRLVDLVVTGAALNRDARPNVIPTVVALGAATAVTRALSAIRSQRQTLLAAAVELHAERRLL